MAFQDQPAQAPGGDSSGEPGFAPGQVLLRLSVPLAGGSQVDPLNTGIDSLDQADGSLGINTIALVSSPATTASGGSSSGNTLFLYRFSFDQALPVDDIAARLSDVPQVLYAEPDYEMAVLVEEPDDPFWSGSGTWGQSYDDLWGLKKIDALGAWQSTTGSTDTVVAVIDTGLDFTHPDIQGNIWNNTGETGTDGSGQDRSSNGVDDDGNGYVDDWRGWDFYNNDNDPTDDHGHGTHVSGTIAAATDNGVGVSGINWRARIMPVKFLSGGGSGYISGAVSSITYAADNGARITNNSWGGGGISQSLVDALAYAHDDMGVTHVAAAGNSNADCANYQPAGMATVITVASSMYDDSKSSFSNWGTKIDVAAPGSDVLSLRAAGTSMGSVAGSNYTRASGTSMASPHVAGVAALMLSVHPEWSNEQVRAVLRTSADDVGDEGRDIYFGFGRVNAGNAVTSDVPPLAMISSPSGTVEGVTDIVGTAGGTGFESYVLEYGVGSSPSEWIELASSTTEVNNSTLYADFDTGGIADGDLKFRLTVTGSQAVASDAVTVNVDNVFINSPETGALLAVPGTVAISGRASGTGFESFMAEHGAGELPESWSEEGVTLTDGGSSPVGSGILAAWDTSSIDEPGFYSIRLTADLDGRIESETVTVYLEPTLHEGWPKQIPAYGTLALLDTPTVADLDGDGSSELLFAYHDKYYVVREDGSDYPGWPKTTSYMQTAQHSPAAGDIDGDGRLEIVGHDGAYTFAWNDDGTVVDGWPVYCSTYTMPVITDMEGDGAAEVVLVAIYKTNSGIRVLNGDGSIRDGWPQPTPSYWQGQPAVGDIDGDGFKDVVFASYDGKTHAYGADGSIISGWPVSTHSYINYSYPALADMDGDGDLEVVIGSNQRQVHVLGDDGSELDGWPQATIGSVESSPAVGDLDNDGDLEVVAGNDRYGYYLSTRKLYAWHADGTLMDGWPVPAGNTNHTFYGYASPAIADIDADGAGEIVVENDTTSLQAYEADGSNADGFPKYTGAIGAFATNTPAVGDFDADGMVEVVSSNFDLKVFMWNLEAAAGSSDDWPGFRHDPAHTGAYVASVPDSVPEVTVLSPSGGELTRGGASMEISWLATDDRGLSEAPIGIDYSTDSGSTWIAIASGEPDDGSFDWTVPVLDSNRVQVRVSATDTDGKAGRGISPAFSIDSTPPMTQIVIPSDGATDVSLQPTASITFNEPLSAETVNGSNVALVSSADDTAVPAVVSYESSNRTVRLDLADSLEAGTEYLLSASAGITDTAGNPLTPGQWSFTTEGDTTRSYFFTWYDARPGSGMGGDWILIYNRGSETADVSVYIAGELKGSYDVSPGEEITPQFPGAYGGPVEVVSNDDQSLMVSQRVIFHDSFNEIFAVPEASLDSTYYFSWYDSRRANLMYGNWILAANVGDEDAHVEISIGGDLMGSFTVAPGEHIAPQFPGAMDGPVKVTATNGQPLLVSQRVIYRNSFNEVTGTPAAAIDSRYYFTWYDSRPENGMWGNWVLAGNLGGVDADVLVYIGGQLMESRSVAPGSLAVMHYPGTMDGPVEVISTNGQPLVVSQRVLFMEGFEEVQGTPPAGLGSAFSFTWYDARFESGMRANWVLVGNQGAQQASVSQFIGNSCMDDIYHGGNPWMIAPGSRATSFFPRISGGPVQVSDSNGQPLLVSQRVVYKNSFNELIGLLPES